MLCCQSGAKSLCFMDMISTRLDDREAIFARDVRVGVGD